MEISGGIAALYGGIAGLVLGCVPGLHIVFMLALAAPLLPVLPDSTALSLLIGLVAGFTISNGIPLALWDLPDDNKVFAAVPAAALRHTGYASDAALWMATGALASVAIVAAVPPVLKAVGAPPCCKVLAYRRALPWVLLGLMLIRLLAPQRGIARPTAIAVRITGLALSGGLGAVLLARSPLHPLALAQTFAPALIGLFSLPSILWSSESGTSGSSTSGVVHRPAPITSGTWGRNLLYGLWSGALLACLPAATGASAGFMCAQFRERHASLRLFAQGASTAGMFSAGLVALLGSGEYGIMPPPRPATIMSAFALSAGAAYLCVFPLVRVLQRLLPYQPATRIGIGLCVTVIVVSFSGAAGFCTLIAAGGIGLLLRSVSVDPTSGLALIVVPLILSGGV